MLNLLPFSNPSELAGQTILPGEKIHINLSFGSSKKVQLELLGNDTETFLLAFTPFLLQISNKTEITKAVALPELEQFVLLVGLSTTFELSVAILSPDYTNIVKIFEKNIYMFRLNSFTSDGQNFGNYYKMATRVLRVDL